MILGFISLLLTFGQSYISGVCISEEHADIMLPCPLRQTTLLGDSHAPAGEHHGPTAEHNPTSEGDHPSTDGHDNPATGHEEPTDEHEHPTDDHAQPIEEHHEPEEEHHEPEEEHHGEETHKRRLLWDHPSKSMGLQRRVLAGGEGDPRMEGMGKGDLVY
ncbi:hypothetical protein ACLOJK_018365 [Asimina triloba]